MTNVATASTFKIIGTKLYAPVVTLPTEKKIKISKTIIYRI